MRSVALVAIGLAVGSAVPTLAKSAIDERATDWRRVASTADRTRLRDWRVTWLAAVAAARTTDAAAVASEGVLLEPDRALGNPVPPSGTYRCRTVKLGTKAATLIGYTAYPWFECQVGSDGKFASFAKTTGSQRPVGLIFKDGASRGVFLGTLALGDESRVLNYGRDANRDMAGLVERIGPRRWRIAFPQPRFESQLDVIELIPAGS